jgi:hypothetical protein
MTTLPARSLLLAAHWLGWMDGWIDLRIDLACEPVAIPVAIRPAGFVITGEFQEAHRL